MKQNHRENDAKTPEETVSSGVLASGLKSRVPKIWLASGSPRRAQLLQTIGVPFELLKNEVQEAAPTLQDHQNPQNYVENLARLKAQMCQFPTVETHKYLHIVLGADTVVWHNGTILNKPEDENQARQMLGKLVGNSHQVFTGLCLRVGENYWVEHEKTTVTFGARDELWIARYVQSGEPMDKAGAYAAQGLGALLIEKMDGDFWNVVGLPLFRLSQMLEFLGVKVQNHWPN